MTRSCLYRVGMGFVVAAAIAGCTTTNPPQEPPQEPIAFGQPLTVDWLAACDTIARDLVMATVFQKAETPQVVEIKPIANSTGVQLDCTVYPEMIRAEIIKSGNTKILFRDNAEASSTPTTPTVIETNQDIRPGHIQPQCGNTGSLLRGNGDDAGNWGETAEVAGVDYYLNGKVYAQNDTATGRGSTTLRYYRFQFRLTDAKKRLIAWESFYQVQRKSGLGVAVLVPCK